MGSEMCIRDRRSIGLLFSVVTAAVVVSMVQVVGALLVTSLLVTPAATAQLVGKSFRSCMLWTQFFGLSSVLLGLYLSAENDTGSGSMIALVAAIIFCLTAIIQIYPNAKNPKNQNHSYPTPIYPGNQGLNKNSVILRINGSIKKIPKHIGIVKKERRKRTKSPLGYLLT